MAIPTINDLKTYTNTKLTGVDNNSNLSKIVQWFSDGTSNLLVDTIETKNGFTGNITGNVIGNITGNVVGNVTGDITGNAGTVTNGVYTIGNQSISGTKTFLNPTIANNLTINNKLNLQRASTTTILGGVITYTASNMIIDTQGGAASDDLTTINGGVAGDILIINQVSAARVITIKVGTGNIQSATGIDLVMSDLRDNVLLYFDGVSWVVISAYINKSFLTSKTENGYTYLPNGLIFQWGNFSVGDATSYSLTYPITFPSATVHISGTQYGTNGIDTYRNGWAIISFSSSGAVIRNVSNGTNSFYWFAIGY